MHFKILSQKLELKYVSRKLSLDRIHSKFSYHGSILKLRLQKSTSQNITFIRSWVAIQRALKNCFFFSTQIFAIVILFLGEDFTKDFYCSFLIARDYSFLKSCRGVTESATFCYYFAQLRLKHFHMYFSVLVLNFICESVSLLQ